MAIERSVTQARAEFADLINQVGYQGERVLITRHGKPLVALVSAAEAEALEDARPAEGGVVLDLSSSGVAHIPRQEDVAAHREPPNRT